MKTSFFVVLASLLFSLTIHAADVFYTEQDTDINNPDRGFYYPYTTTTSSFTPLLASDLTSRRDTPYTPFAATYQVTSTIALRHYVLDSYVNIDTFEQTFLDQIQTDFDTAHTAGVRLILRFSYTITATPGPCSASFICPLYGDAPKDRVLEHINQLAPILLSNSDVILGLQQGFIGVWGENYYTDHFGDASPNDDLGYLTNKNWTDRNEVISALLAAVPSDRMIQLRYPQAKQRFLLGPTAPTNTAPMTLDQAFTETDTARLGMHNDCFLASEDDFGTFADYGNNDSSVASGNSTELKAYAQSDTAYTLVGGETCFDNEAYVVNNCAADATNPGNAIAEMAKYHFSYLNSDYNNDVNNDWLSGNCLDEIKKRLGYRLVLKSSSIPDSAVAGEALTLEIEIENEGFAAPINPRQLWLALRNTETNQEYKLLLDGQNTNPQFWLAGSTIQLETSAILTGVPSGTYSLWLHVADPSNNNSVLDRPEFSIRFANIDTWESTTGYNNLNSNIIVSGSEADILDFLPAIITGATQDQ